MNSKIKQLSDKIKRLQGQLQKMINDCNHNFQPLKPYDPNDECFSSFTQCTNCGKLGDWYCHTSPTKQCEYDMEDYAEDDCIHCHNPSERK